ncbi:MAG: STAS domain-containing protein [Oleibacter sp.]|nr:STAS domain-containing protein [Thalassolituus sp.]
MTITSKWLADRQWGIFIAQRFDFHCQAEFVAAYTLPDTEDFRLQAVDLVKDYLVDFSATHYIDSSALALLLLLREYAQQRQRQVVLKIGQGEVEKMLKISKFPQLFTIIP